LNKKALVNIIAALVAAIISGIILFETLVANNILGEIGLLGIFLSSLFSHLTVIGRGIFGPSFLLMAPIYNPIVLGFFAGWTIAPHFDQRRERAAPGDDYPAAQI